MARDYSSERTDIDKETNSINLSRSSSHYKIYEALPSTAVGTKEQSTTTESFLQTIQTKIQKLDLELNHIHTFASLLQSKYVPQTSVISSDHHYNVSADQPDYFPHSSTKEKVHFLDSPESLCTIEPQISISLLDSSTSGMLQGIDHNEDLEISGQSMQQDPHSMHATLSPLELQSQQNFEKASKEQLATSLEIANGEKLIDLFQITKQYKAMNYEEMQYMLFASLYLARSPLDTIRYLFGIGLAYYEQQKYSVAIEHLRESEGKLRECFQLNPDPTHLSNISLCRVYMGDAEMFLGNSHSARDHFHEAVMTHQPNLVSTLQECYHLPHVTLSAKMAKFASSLRCVNCAEMFYRQSLLCDDATSADIISARIDLGNLLHSVGDNERAVEEYLIAIEEAEKEIAKANQESEIEQELIEQANLSLTWAHGNLGNTYLSLGKKEQGLHHLQLSLELTFLHEPTPSAISRAHNNLGTAYQTLSLFDEAERSYNKALSLAKFGDDIIGQARVYCSFGSLYIIRKNYQKASSHYTEVLRLILPKSMMSIYQRGGSHSLASFNQSAVSERRYILIEVVGKLARLRCCYGVKVDNSFPYDLSIDEALLTDVHVHPCTYCYGGINVLLCHSILPL